MSVAVCCPRLCVRYLRAVLMKVRAVRIAMRRLAARYKLSVFCRRCACIAIKKFRRPPRPPPLFFVCWQRNHRRHADESLLKVVPREMA